MIDTELMNKVLARARGKNGAFAELFIEDKYSSRIAMNDSRIKQAVSGRDFGIGVRVIEGENQRYAYTNDLSEASLLRTADAVANGVNERFIQMPPLHLLQAPNQHVIEQLAYDVEKKIKCDALKLADSAAREVSNEIGQFDGSIIETIQDVWIANSEGLYVSDRRCYTRIAMNVIAQNTHEKQTSSVSPGWLAGYEKIANLNLPVAAKNCAESAIRMLKAQYAPSATLPVIIDNGFGGVIFHEACGHALETTAVSKKASCFCGLIGQQIAHESVTAIDDGTLRNEWGSTNIDDEGMPTQRTVLIEKGILKSYLVDRLGSIQTQYARTGSGRRAGYRYAPTSRMRNTFIAPGEHTLDALISTIEYGLYAKKMGGGSVQPETGDFNFAVTEGYIIRKGKICEPVRGATLIGNGAQTLKKISMCANNFDFAAGICGSQSGPVPTHVGQGAIKVDSMIIGGR